MSIATSSEDLFFDTLVQGYVDKNPRFLRRDWLAKQLDEKLREPGKRFVLLTAEPGAGKSAFMAQLAHDHPEWLRYFIRRDQRELLADVSDKSLLLRIGYQLAAHHPALFSQEQLRVSVTQQMGQVANGAEVIGAEVKRLTASPFYQKILQVEQHVQSNQGKVVGLRVEELVIGEQSHTSADLLHLALIAPARALMKSNQKEGKEKQEQIVILIDALDEIRYHQTTENILAWLTNCPELEENIRFVLTSRPPDEALKLFRTKQASRLTELTIAENDALVQKDVRKFVRSLIAEEKLEKTLSQIEGGGARFAQRVIDKASGNLGYVDALARGLDQALESEDATTLQVLLSLKELPADLAGLYAFFLLQIKTSVAHEFVEVTDPDTGETHDKAVWPAVYHKILGVLAVALEPLDLGLIERLGGIQADHVWVSAALDRLKQFLDVIDGGYRFYHATVTEFLSSTRADSGIAVDSLLVNQRVCNHYWRLFHKHWTRCKDPYAIRNLPWHLLKADQVAFEGRLGKYHERLLALLSDIGYLEKLNTTEGQVRLQQVLILGNSLPVSKDTSNVMRDLLWAVKRNQDHIADYPSSLPSVIYNSLVALGWETRGITTKLQFPSDSVRIRLRFPVDLLTSISRSLPSQFGDPFLCCDLSRDGRFLVTGTYWGDVSIWDVPLGLVLVLKTLWLNNNREGPVSRCRFVSNNDNLVSVNIKAGANTWSVKIWHWSEGTLSLHSSVDFAGQPVAISSTGTCLTNNAQIMCLKTGKVLQTLHEAVVPVCVACFTPRGDKVVTVSRESAWPFNSGRELIVWDVTSGKRLGNYSRHTSAVMCCAATDDYVVSGGGDQWRTHYDSEGRELTGFDGQTLKVWNIRSGEELKSSSAGSVSTCAIAGEFAIAGVAGGYALSWKWEGSGTPSIVKAHKKRIFDCSLTDTANLAAFASVDGTVSIWNMNSDRNTVAHAHRGSITTCAATKNGRLIVSGSTDGSIKVWDTRTGIAIKEFDDHEAGVFCCDISSKGECVVSGSWDEYVRVWDVKENKLVKKIEEHLEVVTCCSMSPTGDFAATGAPDEKMAIVRLRDGKVLTCEHTGRELRACKVLPDGRRIISAGETRMTLWYWQDGELERVRDFDLDESSEYEEILCCEYLPSSDQAVIGTNKRRIKLWQLGERTHAGASDWVAHADSVNGLAVTSDGRYLLSCSDDKTVSAWRVEDMSLRETLKGVVAFKSVCTSEKIICAGDDLGNLWICRNQL